MNNNAFKAENTETSYSKPIHSIDSHKQGTTEGINNNNLVNVNHSSELHCNPINVKFKEKPLSFLYFNAGSVRNKADTVCDYVIENKVDLCAITETWLSEGDSQIVTDITPTDYEFLHVDRGNKREGGVGVLCR